jgi:type IV pilus assembly protein PilQ
MKIIRPAFGLALASCSFLVAGAWAGPGANLPVVRVTAQTNAGSVRIEAQATAAFSYKTSHPNERLLVVELPGLSVDGSENAKMFETGAVAGYRVVPYGSGGDAGVRLEVVLAEPAASHVERSSDHELMLIFDASLAASRRTSWTPNVADTPGPPRTATVVEGPSARISQLELVQQENQPVLRISAQGQLHYHATRLSNPDRLVLDFAGAQIALAQNKVPVSAAAGLVRSVHAGQFQPDVARVVIALEAQTRYTVLESKDGVSVTFAAQQASSSLEAAQTQAETSPVATVASPVPLPQWLTQPVGGLASPQVQNAAPPAPPAAQAPDAPKDAPSDPQMRQQQGMPIGTEKPKYTGEPINVNFKDVDLKDFFRLIHEISGLNVVLDPSVHGTLTLVLDDVPWDQALDIVLKNNNLAKQLDGNVLRIATEDTVKAEAQQRAELLKAEGAAVELVTVTYQLSYARVGQQQNLGGGAGGQAQPIEKILKPFLSPRGDIVADQRTNMLIIRDIPSVIPTIENVIRQLDKKSPQVEVEARIVAASRQFAQDIGAQFAAAVGNSSVLLGGAQNVGTTPSTSTSGSASSCSNCVVLPQLPFISNLPAIAPTSGFSVGYNTPNFALDAILTAAESKGTGKVLSRPRIVTQNNFKGQVKQGEEIPVQTTVNNTISTQYIDAALILDITPQITADGTVSMIVHLENTAIDPSQPEIQGEPALSTQSVDNQILVRDGATVMLGGVMINQQTVNVTQVPLLGSVPIIGNLFKERSVKVTSSELLFFLTPRVVED